MEFKGQKYNDSQAIQIIKKCYANGEPVFIIQGHDSIAPDAIKGYAERQKNAAGPDHPESAGYKLAEDAERFSEEVLRWQLNNLSKVKLAD